jgi:hypothetical protein
MDMGYLLLSRSQPSTPERNRAEARAQDRLEQTQLSPDARRVPQQREGPASPTQGVQNQGARSNRSAGQRARWEHYRAAQAEAGQGAPGPVGHHMIGPAGNARVCNFDSSCILGGQGWDMIFAAAPPPWCGVDALGSDCLKLDQPG